MVILMYVVLFGIFILWSRQPLLVTLEDRYVQKTRCRVAGTVCLHISAASSATKKGNCCEMPFPVHRKVAIVKFKCMVIGTINDVPTHLTSLLMTLLQMLHSIGISTLRSLGTSSFLFSKHANTMISLCNQVCSTLKFW